jgi:hypothetical protein
LRLASFTHEKGDITAVLCQPAAYYSANATGTQHQYLHLYFLG